MKDEIEQEKQQKIVDAVNALQGELTHDNCYFYKEDKYLHRAIAGSYCTTIVAAKDMAGFICTVEEFNQCVKEMSYYAGSNCIGYRDVISELKAKGEDTQLQPKYSGWEPSQGHANCRCTDKKQIEWKNGDKCIIDNSDGYGVRDGALGFLNEECVIMSLFVTPQGIECAAVYHDDNGCEVFRLDMLKKPPAKEKRWLAYNSKINRAMSRGHKTKNDCYNAMFSNRFRDEYQYIEIEINV